MTKESAIQRDIQKFWRKLGGWVFKVHGNEFMPAGIPDLVGCVPMKITQEMVGHVIGVFVGLEAKRDKIEDASIVQLQTIEEIRKAKGYAEVVCSRSEGYAALREAGLVSKGSGRICNPKRLMRAIHGARDGKDVGVIRVARAAVVKKPKGRGVNRRAARKP